MEYQSFYRLMLASAATSAREERSRPRRSDSDTASSAQDSDRERLQHHSAMHSTTDRSSDRSGFGTDKEHAGEGREEGCFRSARK